MAKKVSKKTTKKTARKPAGAAGGAARGRAASPADDRPDAALPPPPRVAFTDIIAQDRALAILKNAIASERLHHAWIFHGPKGVGKFTAALAFAAALLDPTTAPNLSGELAPDPDSPVQRLIAAGTHPDLHIITKELARYSEDRSVRERKLLTIPKDVIDTHLLRPSVLAAGVRNHGLAGKVFIIDEAELLDRSITNAPTQNAILKTLEEPPPGTVIILVTSQEDRLLPTIRSRCQRVAFARLDDDAMKEWMRTAGVSLPPKHARWLLDFADGSPGALLEAVSGDLASWHERLAPLLDTADAGRYSLDLGPTMSGLVDAWASAQAEASKNASKEAANHEGARLLFRLLAARYRTQMRTGNPAAAERAAAAIDALGVAESELRSNVRLVDVCEDLSIRLSEAASASHAAATRA
ncbi:MAG: AAA family ATPase [Phycisphaerales bacterium]|nr:AAA family ATPase [Phycisphaerales bacterium]